MKTLLKVITGIACTLALLKSISLIIDYTYEKYGKKYINVE